MRVTVLPPLLVLLLVGVNPAADQAPAPRPAGKPTRITGPLDGRGHVDYEAALNEWLAKGVTPGTNANVLLVRALGPFPDGRDGLPDEYFRRLGAPRPPKDGDYFVGMFAYGRETLALGPDQLEALTDQEWRASRRPWAADDFPSVAAWLKLNEKPLALVAEATRRPGYYNPLVTRPGKDGELGWLIGVLQPTIPKCREVAGALTARAMLRAGEGRFDDAWADLLACHRLGRLVSRGGTLIEGLTGVAIDQLAAGAGLAYLEAAESTGKQARDRLKDLQNLPPFRPAADLIDVGERCTGLNTLQHYSRGNPDGEANIRELAALEMLDQGEMEKVFDAGYDRMAGAMRLPDRAAREKAFDRLDAEMKAAKKTMSPEEVAGLLKATEARAVSRKFAEALMALQAPSARKIREAFDRAEQVGRNLRLASALAAYRADEGRYPAALTDLAPRYLPAVPDDVFSGKPLTYRPSEKGYLLYSVGVNGKDDGGRWSVDDPPGDDLPVRMPLPKPKKN